jgi:peptidoglycan/xylan/chitin deacetylase (PgdA/CDA1 family)
VKRELGRTARRLKGLFVPSALVLLYHRVADIACDPQWLCVTPRHFAEHLEVLNQFGPTLTVRQLNEVRETGSIPRRAVVVTFDDGYADNLYNAVPLLERHDVPATFFVCSGYVGQEREFWWDDLERLMLHPGMLPATLEITLNGSTHSWPLGSSDYSEEAFVRDRSWNAMMARKPTARQQAYLALCQLLRRVAPEQRDRILAELCAQREPAVLPRSSHRAMTAEELKTLADCRLAEVGAHTVTHPVLAALSLDRQRDEVSRSKNELENIIGHSISGFSYPFGALADYTSDTAAVVRDTGFSCACSNFEGLVNRGTDPYALPRFVVRDWDGETFARVLHEWQYN